MTQPVVEVVNTGVRVVEIPAAVGPPGPQGPPGASAIVHEQPMAAATWSISHQLGRLPVVTLYLDGQPVDAPMDVTETAVVVTWPYPVAGTAILI